ncbi:hypothetical protein TWF696_001797 [Orbilia brochopaga]|uniref:Uncharacterized protein n=1 Tax=Orbilia brochopaga TaxID=3140254 RepID=A0AAV9UA87_9PEZI
MAPKGQRTSSCQWLFGLFVGFIIVVTVTLAVFRDQVVSAIRTLDVVHPVCSPAAASQSSSSHDHGHMHHHKHTEKQPNVPTIYADLKILEELPKANVLWVNKTAGSKPEAWGISMFHALHCIKMWKDSLSPATMMNQHVHSESEYAEHAEHCINYLVQSIMCAGDATIEPAENIVVNNKHGRRIHGMGYTHQCKDTSFLFEMNGKEVDLWDWKQGDTLYSVFK